MFLFSIVRTVFWLVIFSFVGGFFYFVNLIPERELGSGFKVTDAAIILTGGKMRIETGLELLEEGKTRRVFITGVGSDDLRSKINKRLGMVYRNKVELGKLATSTKGNALEAKEWVRKNNIRTISLVTSNYHMPRSLLEFKNYLPSDVEIVPYPAFSDSFRKKDFWMHFNSMRILTLEYIKTLLFLYERGVVK